MFETTSKTQFVATGWQDVVFGAENNKSISVNAIFETTPVFL
jgi:hypothetical protein